MSQVHSLRAEGPEASSTLCPQKHHHALRDMHRITSKPE